MAEVVYISSSARDLEEHRLSADAAVRRAGYQSNGMELYGARARSPVEVCLADVRDCDIYILLLGYRYGSVPQKDNPEGKSYTELEFDEAVRSEKPILVFMSGYDYCSMEHVDHFTRESDNGLRIEAFRKSIRDSEDYMIEAFQTPQELRAVISEALHQMKRSDPPAITNGVLGWDAQALELIETISAETFDADLANEAIKAFRQSKALTTAQASPSQPARQAAPEATGDDPHERVFSKDHFRTFHWYRSALDRANSIASLLDQNQNLVATCFAIDPTALGLDPVASGQTAMMTCNHVLSTIDGGLGAPPSQRAVKFSSISETVYPVQDILFESKTRNGLDCTIFTIEAKDTALAPLPINAEQLPMPFQRHRVFVIGHAGGGELQFSLQNSDFLDHEAPPTGRPRFQGLVRLHYQSSTGPGSSGSPVLNENLECIGIHHAKSIHAPPTSMGMERLNGRGGRYSAGQGIWMGAIKATIEGREIAAWAPDGAAGLE